MKLRHQEDVVRFLNEHQAALIILTEQAYGEAGGHYTVMTAEQRRQQATSDTQELTATLIRGTLDEAEIQNAIQSAGSFAVLQDIVRMVEAHQRLLGPFIQARLPADSPLATEVMTRMNSLTVRFRLSLSAAEMTNLVQQPDTTAPATSTRKA